MLMSPEFDKLLEEYRKLAIQVEDERGYLDWLTEELQAAKQKLDEFVEGRRGDPQLHLDMDAAPTVRHEPSIPALQETARALAILGDGVTAQQLAQHLGITGDAARLRLQRAARKGLIARMGTGRYRAIKRAPAPENALNTLSGLMNFADENQVQGTNGEVVQE